MAHQVIGHCACPLCRFPHQEIRKSEKNGKPYIVCDECGMQLFSRQARSVKLLNQIAAESKPEPEQQPKQAAKPEPKPKPKPVASVPEPAPAPAKPVPAKPEPEEKTIFDCWPFKTITTTEGE